MQVELVTRRGCHLCDEALARLQACGVEVVARDVDTDPELFRLYDFRVPVVLLAGKVLAEGVLTDAEAARIARG